MAKHLTESEAWRILDRLRDDFRGLRRKWSDRRTVRYRRMDRALRGLPLNQSISDKALMVVQTEGPNQEVHRRVKRLVANSARFEIVLFDSDSKLQSIGQGLEDGTKALYRWMTSVNPTFEWDVAGNQQGDGLGVIRADFIPSHGMSLADFDIDDLTKEEGDVELPPTVVRAREAFRTALEKRKGDETLAYNDVTNQALKAELPPYRLSGVDPLSFGFWEDGDGIAVAAEVGKKSLNPLLQAFGSYGLKVGEDGRLVVTPGGSDAVSAKTSPDEEGRYSSSVSSFSPSLGDEVNYAELRTREEILILIEHPKAKNAQKPKKTDYGARGIVLRFDNPFGPYTTGYELVPGDVTTEIDPADRFQPPVLGTLSLAQQHNVLMTARMSAALEAAMTSKYVEVKDEDQVPPSDEEKTKESVQGREIPVIAGNIRRVEAPNVDLDKAELSIRAEEEEYKFREVLQGGAKSEDSGHKLAIQVSQADLQITPYQNSRKRALERIMKGIIYAIRKHGLPVFIPTLPDSARKEREIRVSEPVAITPEMADLPFELVVHLGADTPVTKFALWSVLQDRVEKGSLGYESMMEEMNDNPQFEIERVFKGKLLQATMEQLLPKLIEAAVAAGEQKLAAFLQSLQPQVVAPAPAGALPGPTGASGLEGGGGAPPIRASDVVRLPGANQEAVQTQVVDGQRVPEGTGEQVS